MALGRHKKRRWWSPIVSLLTRQTAPQCQWCGDTEDLAELEGQEFGITGTYHACNDTIACHRRYWNNN